MTHHAAGLARLCQRQRDPALIPLLQSDYTQAPINDRERALLDYAAKLTRTPQAMTEADLTPMRNAGLSDADILDANLVTAYFAFVNRIADGLGVALEPYVGK